MTEKNNFFLGSPPEKNKEGLEYSKIELIKPVKINDKKISEGGYGKIYEGVYKIVNGGDEVELVKKEFKKDLEFEEIESVMRKFNKLKKAGIEAVEIYTDGKNLYSENLNKNNKIAVSWNNSLKNDLKKKFESIKDSIEINNFDEVLEKMIDNSIKSMNVGISLAQESLFYLVDTEKINQDIEFMVGDYDIIVEDLVGDYNVALVSLTNNIVSLNNFIEKFVKKEKKQIYIEKIKNRLKIDIAFRKSSRIVQNHDVLNYWSVTEKQNKILTKDGLKDLEEYSEDDFVFKEWFSESSNKTDILRLVNNKYGKKFTADEIVMNKKDINENTRLFVGNLKNGDEEILNNRKEPLMIAGKLLLFGSKKIKKIPDNFEVTGRVNLQHSNLNEIGKKVRFYTRPLAETMKVIYNIAVKTMSDEELDKMEKMTSVYDIIKFYSKIIGR